MAEEVELDQKVYDELIAAGKSERIARAKAKAATMRARKAAAGEKAGPREAGESTAAPRKEAAAATASGGAAATGAVGTQAGAGGAPGMLTPEERQARVAAALAQKGNGAAARTAEAGTRYASQDHTHRLLAMVPPDGIQQIRGKQEDKVYVWPHLIASEFICILVWTAGLTIFSALVEAPLRELANPNLTPNPSKAPWYFLGLQEMLRYFHPMVAGVTIPTIGIVLGMAFPFLDKNPSIKPESRKTAVTAFTFFLIFAGVLVITGSFFRGPGFNFIWPWTDGLFFEL
ncbi:MAG: menaquinol-cytochrome c reductase cytochrome b subunit [Nitriliruptorales bacterium]|nr:menaquinol-cytochrome c reductase cytochrome b subunit [Nitriliruptorales bacterium]